MSSPETARRLSVLVAPDVGDAIDQLARRHGTTITDVIRRAVSVLKYIDDAAQDNGKILVKHDDVVQEVRFLW